MKKIITRMRHPYGFRIYSSVLTTVAVLRNLKAGMPAMPLTLILLLTAPALPGTIFSDTFAAPTGQISYPVPSPSNPDIIAYTREEDNRHVLHLYHVATRVDEQISNNVRREQTPGQSNPGNLLRFSNRFETSDLIGKAGLPSGHFEGDFSWSPVLDPFGYQWFAYTATHSGKTQLHIGYIKSQTTLHMSVFPVAFGSVVANPVFSPDGKALVFSADGDLYLVPDINNVIRKRDFSAMNPIRITDNPAGSFFPAWSHDSGLIAYQSSPVEGDRAGLESIYVVEAYSVRPGQIPTSHRIRVSDAGSAGSRHLRPSWAPSTRTLAFYEHYDPAGSGQNSGNPRQSDSTESENGDSDANRPYDVNETDEQSAMDVHQNLNIRVVELVFNHSQNRWAAEPLPGRARDYIAESAIAFPRSAPQWATVELDQQQVTGILWVRHDPELGNPLYFSNLSRYSETETDFTLNMFSFSNRFSWLEPTMNNRYPAIVNSAGSTRYVYVKRDDVDDDQDRLAVIDRRSATSDPVVKKEIHIVPPTIRSGLYPGWGHFQIGENRRGTYLAGTFTAIAGATLASSIIRYQNEGPTPGNAFLISLGAATAAIWAFNIVDLQRQFPVYREIPVAGTFEGYTGDRVAPGQISRQDITHNESKTRAMLYSALYPGLGHLYISQKPKAYLLSGVFTVFAGSTFAGAAYRYILPGPIPSDGVLIGMGAATFGIWIYSLLDLQQSFTYAFFADAGAGGAAGITNSQEHRPVFAIGPSIENLQIGNQSYRNYAAVGLSFSF